MKSQTFGEKLKELRTNLKYSLKFVGEKIAYSPRSLSKIEKNEKKAPERIIKSLSKIYDVPYKELIIKYLSESVYYQVRHSEYADEILNTAKKRIKKEGKGTQMRKNKDKIFESIKDYFSDKPIEKAYVFGSFARNTSISLDSDIDILVVFKKPNKITLFDIIQMKSELSDKTGREIDLVEEGQELKSIKNTIQKEKVLVYAS
jgi:predicted nucleotidyltransferase/DNA-binding XRE family transcriptional regulator